MASIKDVAQLAGVSFSTVSIIINGKAAERKISEETQQRVREAMKQLQYRPNISAKKLKDGENDKLVIALFWSFDFRKAMLARFLTGLQECIQESQADIEIVVYAYKNKELYKEQSLIQGNQFHAAIIANASDEDMSYLNSIQTLVPIVLYNRFSDKYSSVNIRDEEIGRLAAEHLYDQGYRKTALVTSVSDFSGMLVREKAFVYRMEELGGSCLMDKIVTENSVEGGVAAGRNMLAGKLLDQADSLFCASDAIAIGITHSLYEAGYSVPEKTGIIAIGNGNPHYSKYNNPPLTVVNIPMEQMAHSCYDLVIREVNNMNDQMERIYFETEIHARCSTEKK